MENLTEYKRPRKGRLAGTRSLTCQDCLCNLDDTNWSESCQKYRRFMCKKCWNLRQKLYDKRTPAEKSTASKIRRSGWDAARRQLEADKSYERRLKKEFDITLDDYKEILQKQGGVCKICKSDKAQGRGRFHVDHCHKNGQIRGLLCAMCNLLSGKAKDSVEILESAIKYLKESEVLNDSRN